MSDVIEYLRPAILIGTGATAFMDLIALARKRMFGVPSGDYGMVGRWLAYLARGRFRHDPIAASSPVRGERTIGWIAHYLIGIAFAILLLGFWGIDWTCRPTLSAALTVGVGSVAAPFLLMQPGMGFGVAASRSPRPAVARMRSLVTHGIFGTGLYVAVSLANLLGMFDC